MSFPTLLADAAFTVGAATSTYLTLGDRTRGLLGTGTLGPAGGVWTDISAFLHAATVDRGVNRVESPILSYEPGRATVRLNNSDRRFDPSNLSGPYVAAGATQVTPMRGLRLRAVWDGVTYDLWRGFAHSWGIDYTPPSYSSVTVTGVDAFDYLANYRRSASGSVGAGESTGARVNRILNSVNWPAVDRVVATGDSTLQATTLAGDALAELQLAADSEIGDLYIDGGGRVVFRGRQAPLEELRSIQPVAQFGDRPTFTADTTVNLLPHPSSETVLGWSGAAFANPPVLTQDSTHVFAGSFSALASWVTGGSLPLISLDEVPTLSPGAIYTFSVYVWVPTGSPPVAINANGSWGNSLSTTNDQWERLTWTGPAPSSNVYFQVWPYNSTASTGQQVWLDAAQLETGPVATDYCDGDQAGCQWDGTAHSSSSRRLVELAYTSVTPDYDKATLVNLVRATRVGGAEQVAQDTAGQAVYLTRTGGDRTDLLLQTDAEALNWANWVLYQSKDPELRFAEIVISPQRDPVRLWPQVLGRDIGDRIRIIVRPPGGGSVTRDVFIRGVHHEIDCQKRTWRTTWQLQSASKYAFFTLGSTTLGVLGANALAW